MKIGSDPIFESSLKSLRRIGKEWLGSCALPDHEDRSPSFTVNSEKNVLGARIAASLTIRAPESASVCLETAVTLTGTFCASAGSLVAVTVTVGSVVRRMPSSSGFAGCCGAGCGWADCG